MRTGEQRLSRELWRPDERRVWVRKQPRSGRGWTVNWAYRSPCEPAATQSLDAFRLNLSSGSLVTTVSTFHRRVQSADLVRGITGYEDHPPWRSEGSGSTVRVR